MEQQHWLACRFDDLVRRADAHAAARAHLREDGRAATDEELQARAALVDATRRVVADVAAKDGVSACFVAHDGLLAHCAGQADFEAFAAFAQTCAATAAAPGLEGALGPVHQLVLVGAEHKLALLLVGQVALGIVCPAATDLARVLGH